MDTDKMMELCKELINEMPMSAGMRRLVDVMTNDVYSADPKHPSPADVFKEFGFETDKDIDMLIQYVMIVASRMTLADLKKNAQEKGVEKIGATACAGAGWIDGFAAGLLCGAAAEQ